MLFFIEINVFVCISKINIFFLCVSKRCIYVRCTSEDTVIGKKERERERWRKGDRE